MKSGREKIALLVPALTINRKINKMPNMQKPPEMPPRPPPVRPPLRTSMDEGYASPPPRQVLPPKPKIRVTNTPAVPSWLRGWKLGDVLVVLALVFAIAACVQLGVAAASLDSAVEAIKTKHLKGCS